MRFKAVGRAPILVDAKQRGQIGSDQKFGALANHLRRQLKLKASESLVHILTEDDRLMLVLICEF